MSDLTVSAADLLNATGSLLAIGGYSIPDGKGSYALAKIKRQTNDALKDLEVARIGLCEQHAEKDDAGKPMISPEGQYVFADKPAFDAAWAQLLEEPVTLPGCRPILLDELEGATQVIRFPDDPKRIEIIRGLPSDLLFGLGPLVIEAPPQPAVG